MTEPVPLHSPDRQPEDPDAALRRTNAKFERRFRRVEALLRAEGRGPEQSDLEEMDRLWDRAKVEERAKAEE